MGIIDKFEVVFVGVLALLCLTFFSLWRAEVHSFAEYKAQAELMQRVAEEKAAQVKAEHEKIVEDVSNAWNNQVPYIRSGAVLAYIKHQRMLQQPSAGDVPGAADGAQKSDATAEERLACTAEFIRDAGQDAYQVMLWQDWATRNHLKIE